MSRSRGSLAMGAALIALLALPAGASAVDRYVDAETGADATACTSTATPCDTIGYAIDQAGPGDIVVVDDTATGYNEALTLDDGIGLDGFNFAPPASEANGFLVTSATAATITVAPSGAGTISDLTLRTTGVNGRALWLNGEATVTGNTFDQDTAGYSEALHVASGSGSSAIVDNDFVDDGVDAQSAITVFGSSPQVSLNSFWGFQRSVNVDGASAPVISDNEIVGTYGGQPAIGLGPGTGAILQANSIAAPGSSDAMGVFVVGDPTTRLTMIRNRISGYAYGLFASNTGEPVELHGDLITDSTNTGVFFADQGPAETTPPELLVNGATITSPIGPDLRFSGTPGITATIDSTLLGPGGIDRGATSTCAISFSRGELTDTPGDLTDCNDFQTTADPNFIGGGNYHLTNASPLIDAGNPAAPVAPDLLDIDFDPRAIDGDGACPLDRIRDIGADEVLFTEPTCTPPVIVDPPVTPPPAKKKKCKRAKKRNAAASAKKKKCKKRKKRR